MHTIVNRIPPRHKWRRLIGRLGPGIVSGASNDDPSCIVAYSIAGASFGYLTLWTSVFALPLIAAVQLMCSRLGMVTGHGVAGAVQVTFSKRVLIPTCVLLVIANTVTISADLAGMGEVTEMVTGMPHQVWAAIYAALTLVFLFYFPYHRIAGLLKWLSLILFVYVAAAVLGQPDWKEVIIATFLPRLRWSKEFFAVVVAIVGATMSPYFLFWQAQGEVEEDYGQGRTTVAERRGASDEQLQQSTVDVLAGSFISKVITYFITLTTAATLFVHGKTDINSAREAAAALEPIAGPAAFWLFALGVIGTGFLAVPVLAGSGAYAIAEAARWQASLHEHPYAVPKFYGLVLFSVAAGVALVYADISIVHMLFWASVCNGVLAPYCILLVLVLTGRREIMGERTIKRWVRALGWVSFVLTGAAAIAMLVSFL